jgi:hypothetical protein
MSRTKSNNKKQNKGNELESLAHIHEKDAASIRESDPHEDESGWKENPEDDRQEKRGDSNNHASVSYTEKIDHVLEELGNGDKPWFLSSTEIYKATKDAVASIPKGKDLFDQSLRSLSLITKKINASTNLNVAFEIEQSYDLINQLDAILADNLVIVDDGLDDLRGSLTGKLRNLITAVVQHKNWAESYVVDKKESAKSKVLTRYEQALNMLNSLAGYIESKFPIAYAQVASLAYSASLSVEELTASVSNRTIAIKDAAHSTYTASVDKTKETIESAQHKVDGIAIGLLQFGLRVAQPYVHHAMELTVPYVNQAICLSTPVVKPYVEPVVRKAKDFNENLKETYFIGKYISKANDVATHVLHETQSYCIPSTVEIGVF